MSDLTERLQHAASAAIGDLGPTIERDQKRVRSVLFEIELSQRSEPLTAHAWLDYRASVSKLLAGPPLPAEAAS